MTTSFQDFAPGQAVGTSHQTYLNVENSNEFFAIDVWDNLKLSRSCSDPNLAAEFAKMLMASRDGLADAGWLQF
jgi:hypothetical protein